MSRTKEELQGVTSLGNQHTAYTFDYDPSLLETFINKHPGRDYFVKFNCPEFTSLCPKTGQPDYATLYISYVPDQRMVESKSLKLYLFSFRNHGDFHEDCVNIIMDDLQLRPCRNSLGAGSLAAPVSARSLSGNHRQPLTDTFRLRFCLSFSAIDRNWKRYGIIEQTIVHSKHKGGVLLENEKNTGCPGFVPGCIRYGFCQGRSVAVQSVYDY